MRFLKALWGYDPNRIWRVEAIQKTAAPDVSKVMVFVSDKTPNAKVQPTAFFVTPDGKHAMAGDAVIPFGATPFADARKTLQERADGAARGAAGKDLMLVEFADLQCPHCKEAQGTMDQLVKDFPNARVVFQSFPLVDLHPFAFKAAAYGYCVAEAEERCFLSSMRRRCSIRRTALTAETGDADAEERCDQGWAGSGGGGCVRGDAGDQGPGECVDQAGGGGWRRPDADAGGEWHLLPMTGFRMRR